MEVMEYAKSHSLKATAEKYDLTDKAIKRWINLESNPLICEICSAAFPFEKEMVRHKIKHLDSKEERRIARLNLSHKKLNPLIKDCEGSDPQSLP